MKHIAKLLIISLILLISCEKEDTEINFAISIDEAKVLIADWLVDEFNTEVNASTTFTVKEFTTNEMYEKLNGQLFSATSEEPSYIDKQVFVKNGKVYDLLPGFQYLRERDRFNFFVTDLNNDANYELTFSAFAGSGILYQQVNCHYFDSETQLQSYSTTIAKFPFEYEINLKSNGYQHLDLVYNDAKQNLKIGEVKLIAEDQGENLKVEMREDIPQVIMDKIEGKTE